MNFGHATTEFYARGFSYLNDTTANRLRARRYIAQGFYEVLQDLIDAGVAPYAETTWTTTAPFTSLATASAVQSVYDSTNDTVLQWADRRTLIDMYGDLTTTGTPIYWYTEGAASSVDGENPYTLTLKVYPANTTASLRIRTVEGIVASGPSTASDTFVFDDENEIYGIPVPYQYMVVDRAVIHAYWDNDEADMGDRLEKRYQEISLPRAVRAGALQHLDNTDYIISPAQDY